MWNNKQQLQRIKEHNAMIRHKRRTGELAPLGTISRVNELPPLREPNLEPQRAFLSECGSVLPNRFINKNDNPYFPTPLLDGTLIINEEGWRVKI